jgi:enterochelin esterase-like enzyme
LGDSVIFRALFLFIIAAPLLAFGAAPHMRFVLKTHADRVALLSPLTQWAPLKMDETSPGEFSIDLISPWVSTLAYKFQIDGKTILDPTNPNTMSDGSGGKASAKDTGFQDDPLLSEMPDVPAWTRTSLKIPGTEKDIYDINIVSPPSGQYGNRSSVTVYFLDGDDYLYHSGAANLIANLSQEGDMPLITGVFVSPTNRDVQYVLSQPYAELLASQVVPEVEKRFNTGGQASHRMIIGGSLGGLHSVFTSLNYPQVFGNAAAQSGSFWERNIEILDYVHKASHHPLNLYLDVGSYETAEMTSSTQRVAEALKEEDMRFKSTRYPGVHDGQCWKNRMPIILRYFFRGMSK